jgi:hypothetical protein
VAEPVRPVGVGIIAVGQGQGRGGQQHVLVARPRQGRHHLGDEQALRRPVAPEHPAQRGLHQHPLAAELLVPVLGRDQRQRRVPQPAADELDAGGAAQALQDGRDVRQVAAGVDQRGVAQLLQQHRRQGHVQAGDVGVLVGVAGDPLVAEEDPPDLARVPPQQLAQVVRGLVEVQAEGVMDGVGWHGCLVGCGCRGVAAAPVPRRARHRHRSAVDEVARI